MYLKGMRLQNYGAFRDTGWLTFSSGVNLIVGQNNSGKSSLIKSFANELRPTPHISLDEYRAEDLKRPWQEFELVVTGDRVRRALLKWGGIVSWPLSDTPTDVSPSAIKDTILGPHEYTMRFERGCGGMQRIENVATHSAFPQKPTHFIELRAVSPEVQAGSYGGGYQDTIVPLLQQVWSGVFIFDTERTSVGQCAQNEVDKLATRAENLPAYLHLMRGRRPAVFDKLVEHVRTIIPTVYSLTTTPVGQQETRILVWPTERMDKEEFGFPLAESGTGVGQVIAILAAAMASDDPTIIVIDEINSYLHPTAVKLLLRLLDKSYGHHQYIISTHSPEVISTDGVKTVCLVKRDGMESTVTSVDMSDIQQLREMADHIGVSVSDVFAADYVLWVEGRTEEVCFSLLKDKLGIPFPSNTIISSVVATGDFFSHKRDVELVFQIYERLARVSLPLVRSVAFSFDREDLSPTDIRDTIRRAGGQVRFLPRRHLECYLIIPVAITALANSEDLERDSDYSVATVESCLKARAGHSRYLASDQWNGELDNAEWLAEVDAARLIADVLADLTDQRLSFKKVEHSVRLLDHIIATGPSPIDELAKYVGALGVLLASKPSAPEDVDEMSC